MKENVGIDHGITFQSKPNRTIRIVLKRLTGRNLICCSWDTIFWRFHKLHGFLVWGHLENLYLMRAMGIKKIFGNHWYSKNLKKKVEHFVFIQDVVIISFCWRSLILIVDCYWYESKYLVIIDNVFLILEVLCLSDTAWLISTWEYLVSLNVMQFEQLSVLDWQTLFSLSSLENATDTYLILLNIDTVWHNLHLFRVFLGLFFIFDYNSFKELKAINNQYVGKLTEKLSWT